MSKITKKPTDADIAAAEVLGQAMLETEPRAVSAHFDRASGRVVVDLVNGSTFAVPAHLVQDLAAADPDDLAVVEVDGLGFNLHWPSLDADLSVPALAADIFGTRAWMTKELARRAGRATSPAKAAASRTNGAKGGSGQPNLRCLRPVPLAGIYNIANDLSCYTATHNGQRHTSNPHAFF